MDSQRTEPSARQSWDGDANQITESEAAHDSTQGDNGTPHQPLCAEHPTPLAVLGFALPFALSAAAGVAGFLLAWSGSSNRLAPAAFIVSAFLLVTSGVAPVLVYAESRTYKRDERRCVSDCKDLADALEGLDDRTMKGLASANFTQMRRFTLIAQRQARMSFYASGFAASCVLLLLTAGGAATVGVDTRDAQIVAGALTAIASALGSFLTATFIRSYAMATRQMSYYYGQPLVHCYLLHAAWLASGNDRLSNDPEKQWEKIIDATLRAAHDAQTHLLSA